MEKLSLIDVTTEDDLLISSFSGSHQDLRSSENHGGDNCFSLESTNAHEGGNLVKISQQWENVPEMSQSPEQKQAKSGKFNLRKSLAWDSAFFTSEGVLDTDELAIANGTFRKTEVCLLPGIQEELQKSAESTSTLDSESYTLENLEGDLFENLRASIQMSLNKRDNCSSREAAASQLGSGKKVELPSQTKMKPPVALKRDGLNRQRLECTSKGAGLGVKEALKANGDSKLPMKPPPIVPKPTSLLNARSNKDSSGSIQMKNNTRSTSSGNGANRQGIVTFSKANGDSCSITSRSISSLKPNPAAHLGSVVVSTASCLSNGSLVGSSSHLAAKSPLESMRKRSALRNSDHTLSGSNTKTPVRALKSKLGPSNRSRPPTSLNSTLKFSSRASPSSSIDSVVSEASSSTSTSIKPSNSMESLPSPPSSSSLVISANLLQNQPIAISSVSTSALSEPSKRDHARSSINSSAGAKSFKSSGLRMPSPKIGYFDAEKTLVSTSNKIPQIGPRNSLLKGNSRTSDTVGANKLKSCKIPSIRPASQHVATNTHHTQSSSLPPHSRRLASPLLMRQHPKPTQVDKDSSPVTSEGNQSMACQGTVTSEGGSAVTQKENRATYQFAEVENREQLTCGYNQDGYMENELHSVQVQKENLFSAYEINCLTQHLPSECQKTPPVEIMDKKMSSLSLSETSDL